MLKVRRRRTKAYTTEHNTVQPVPIGRTGTTMLCPIGTRRTGCTAHPVNNRPGDTLSTD